MDGENVARARSRTAAAGIAIADKARNERNRGKCCTDLIILWQRKGEEREGREDSRVKLTITARHMQYLVFGIVK